jgi:hypothetical protein
MDTGVQLKVECPWSDLSESGGRLTISARNEWWIVCEQLHPGYRGFCSRQCGWFERIAPGSGGGQGVCHVSRDVIPG